MKAPPLTLWVSLADYNEEEERGMLGLFIETTADAAGAVEYIRKDVVEAWLETARQG